MTDQPLSGILTGSLHAALKPWIGGAPEIQPLPGGLTNRNFRITGENGERFVLRMAGAETSVLGIRRAHEWVCLRQAFALGIGVEPLFWEETQGIFLMRFADAAPLDPASLAGNPERLAKLAALLRTLHGGPAIPGRFDVFEVIASYQESAARRGHPFPAAFVDTALRRARLELFLRRDQPLVPCHNDLLAGNLLHDGTRLLLLDWEYAGMGDARFDLANLISNLELEGADRACFLEAWFGSSDQAGAWRPGIDAMLIMSDLREAAWGFLQAA
ncbi:MAG: hypothetical protein EOP86_20895, partial [Verrucomicrobiaceae bacterium]